MDTCPSGPRRTSATDTGNTPPALVEPQAIPSGASRTPARRRQRDAETKRRRLERRFTSTGRSFGWSISPRLSRFRSRNATGSISRSAAISSICDSQAKMVWGAATERKEPAPSRHVGVDGVGVGREMCGMR